MNVRRFAQNFIIFKLSLLVAVTQFACSTKKSEDKEPNCRSESSQTKNGNVTHEKVNESTEKKPDEKGDSSLKKGELDEDVHLLEDIENENNLEDARLRLTAILLEGGIWEDVPPTTWNLLFKYFGGPHRPETELDIMWDMHYKVTRNMGLNEVKDAITQNLGEGIWKDVSYIVLRRLSKEIRAVLKDSLAATRIETTDLWDEYRQGRLYDTLNPCLRATIADFQLKIDLIRSSPSMRLAFKQVRKSMDDLDPEAVIHFVETVEIRVSDDPLVERQLELFRHSDILLERYARYHPAIASSFPLVNRKGKE